MALLVEIAKISVSGVAPENILYPYFVNWGTTGSCFIYLSSQFMGFDIFLWPRLVKNLSEGEDEN